ncbi:MAG TPA: DoxX family protein [Gemmatimonadales bacterium]|nr:DoxX family protein [Gemmatimonadales bacterium]
MTGVTKPAAFEGDGRLTVERIRHTRAYRYTLLPRVVAGVPLLGIGLAHVFAPEAPMRPLVEAAGLPFAAVVSPVAVAIEVVAGLSLLLGLWARIGALLAIPTMLGAIYAHLAIGVWPNGPENEPPIGLPIAVAACAGLILWKGAGRWSADHRHARRGT